MEEIRSDIKKLIEVTSKTSATVEHISSEMKECRVAISTHKDQHNVARTKIIVGIFVGVICSILIPVIQSLAK